MTLTAPQPPLSMGASSHPSREFDEPALHCWYMCFVRLQGVQCIAYSPLGHSDPTVLNNEVLQQVAQELGRSSAQVKLPNPPCCTWLHHRTCSHCIKQTLCIVTEHVAVLCCAVVLHTTSMQ